MEFDPTVSPGTLLGGFSGIGSRLSAAPAGLAGGVLTSFGTELLGAASSSANAVVSPYSVYTVLAMAATGATGRTAEQLVAALGGLKPATAAGCLTAVDAAVQSALFAGAASTRNPQFHDARPMMLCAATSLFVQRGLAVHPAFLDALAAGFGTGIRHLDYAANPEVARAAVNTWVGDRTLGRIEELLDRGTVTPDTVLSLVNALVLTAPWRTPFRIDPGTARFDVLGGAEAEIRFLRSTSWCAHSAGEGWRSVTVAYRGGGLAMTLVVPDPGCFSVIRSSLPAVLTAVRESSQGRSSVGPVDLTMPGFAIDTRASLVEHLRAAGVTDLFDPESVDLSGIAGDPGYLVASELVHRAVITVDKDGTEAAAATAMTMSATGAPVEPTRIVVNSSFLFSVHDTVTGAPLFLGQVIDPTS